MNIGVLESYSRRDANPDDQVRFGGTDWSGTVLHWNEDRTVLEAESVTVDYDAGEGWSVNKSQASLSLERGELIVNFDGMGDFNTECRLTQRFQ